MNELEKNTAFSGGFRYLPETPENGPLAKYELGETVTKLVRPINCIYSGNQGYQVYNVEENQRFFVIAGTFPYVLALNSYYKIVGEVTVDKKGIRQIKVKACESALPSDRDGIITVLRTLHGLDTQAPRLYEIVGPDVLELIKTSPNLIAKTVKGVGIKRAKMWQAELLQRGENDKELKKLYRYGLTPQQATKLVSEHSILVCDEVDRNPYLLKDLMRGYTFRKCDKIAMENGFSVENMDRIRAGLMATMGAIEERGHCAYPFDAFLKAANDILDVSIGAQGVQQILRGKHQGELVPISWGNRTYTISINDMAGDYADWRAANSGTKKRYQYLIERIPEQKVNMALSELQTNSSLVIEESDEQRYVYKGVYYEAERTIASAVREFRLNERLPFDDVESKLDGILQKEGIQLEAKQREAVLRICRAQGGIFILNGSAGCGKTFTLNIIIKLLYQLYREMEYFFYPCILAPTGKAAKVASQSTNLQAYTIHKALGLVSSDDSSFRNQGGLSNNCVIVDETSMVDELLCASLFSGIPKTAKVVLLGDTAQLPSVRPGRVLRDMIESGAIPVITLDVVKRQSAKSGVLLNATKIAAGENIGSIVVNKNGLRNNAYVMPEQDVFNAQAQVLKMASQFGLSAFQNGTVQVLCPLKAGPTGIAALNYFLQQKLNPPAGGPEVTYGKIKLDTPDDRGEEVLTVFRPGDVVMHTKNNYEQPWFTKHPVNGYLETSKTGVINGDTGVISDIKVYKDSNGYTHKVIYVKYDEHYIAYDNDYEELMPAYALTIHKSQGSQWPVIICPIAQQTILLNRKLMYTMYTRASDTNILIGRPEYIARAIADDREDRRITRLCTRLKEIG